MATTATPTASPKTKPRAKWEVITPEMAKRLLGRNPRNRNLLRSRVEALAAAILRGEWQTSGETIKIADDGTLIDGQHRLAACVEAGVPIESLVVRGLPAEAQDVVDLGRARQFSDMLKIRGEPNSAAASAATRALYLYKTFGYLGGVTGGGYATPQMLFAIYNEHRDGIQGGLTAHNRLKKNMPGTYTSGIATLHYLIGLADGEADLFMEKLAYGDELQRDDPIFLLRARLSKERQTARMTPRQKFALTIKAYNLWQAGEQAQQLTWKPSAGEPFPLVANCPLNPVRARR